MKLLYPRCCVLSLQGQTVLACLRIQDAEYQAREDVRTFAIRRAELAAPSEWLTTHTAQLLFH